MPFDTDGVIRHLDDGEFFVFGSNVQGRHGRGAALQAKRQFGAVYGIGEGLTGQCYALPTCTYIKAATVERLEALDLRRKVAKLNACVTGNPSSRFLVTKVGCGLAGIPEEEMRWILGGFLWPRNVEFPPDWTEFH